MNLQVIAPILEEIVKESLSEKVYLYGRFQKSLTSRVASGRLRDSIKAKVISNKQGVQVIQITYLGGKTINQEGVYAYWLANDRKPNGGGGFANIGAIEQWIRDKKSFRIRDFKTGKFLPKNDKNIKSTAFVVARSIGRFGYQNKPKNFVDISYDKIVKDTRIIALIEDQAFEDLLNQIEGL
jgi:hypothetical protein